MPVQKKNSPGSNKKVLVVKMTKNAVKCDVCNCVVDFLLKYFFVEFYSQNDVFRLNEKTKEKSLREYSLDHYVALCQNGGLDLSKNSIENYLRL